MNDATQSPVRFGAGNSLVGMVTTPAYQAPATTACLMFNMGANHRVGPRRINVKLAHSLAARGMASLRFDLGGVGDSDAFDSAHDLQTRSVHDLQAAMDLVENMLGIRQFVIVGMCSGVEHAMSTAAVDGRVVALSLFDGFAFPERRARWERTLRRAIAAPAHPSFPGKTKRWLIRRLTGNASAKALPGFLTEKQPPEVRAAWFGATLNRLAEREVALQLLYSGSLHVCDRDRDQLGALRDEPFAKTAQYKFMRNVDHTFCTAEGQQLYMQTVGDWAIECARSSAAERRNPSPSPSPATSASPAPAVADRPLRGAYAPQ
jgi:dienelactone hydrolase